MPFPPDPDPADPPQGLDEETRSTDRSGPDGSATSPTWTSASSSPVAPPGYELLDEVGGGGMGVVYRARDIELDRDVAVKLLRDQLSPDGPAARRFLAEAQITGQLQHPGIPPVHRVGKLPDGRPFLVMKLIKGRTLADALSDGRVDRGRLVATFEKVCDAVAFAHAHKVIHRDLKPANVMVGNFGEVQVMDWGLAKVLTPGAPSTPVSGADDLTMGTEIRTLRESDGTATLAGSVLGTPAYMPPEQAIGAVDQIDRRSDVFGLGAILCAILTGKPPYLGADSESTRQLAARAKLDDSFARLDACGAEPELVALCKRCLSAEKSDRPADADDVARAVAGLRAAAEERARAAELESVRAEGERAKAEAESREQRKRRRVQLALAASILVLLGLAAGGTWWVRADRQARAAAEAAERAATEGRVAAALAEADRHASQGDWVGAVAAARRGVDLAHGGRIDDDLRARAEERARFLSQALDAAERDRRLTLALLDAAVPEETITSDRAYGQVPVTARAPDPESGYRTAFADYGLDLDARPEEAYAILSQRPDEVRLDAVTGLHNWVFLRNEHGDVAGAARLAALIDRLDPDPDEGRLRAMILDGSLRLQRSVQVIAEAMMPFRQLASPPPNENLTFIRKLAAEVKNKRLSVHRVFVLTMALHEAGDADRALTVVRTARQARPEAPMLAFAEAMIHLKRQPQGWNDAIGPLEAARVIRPEAGLLLVLAQLNLKRTTEAIALAEDMVRRRPGHPTPRRMLAMAFLFSGRAKEAEAVLTEVVRDHPHLAHPRHHLGLAQVLQERWPEAESSLREAARLAPTDADIRRQLGMALIELDRPREAEAEFREALRLRPDNAESRNSLGATLFMQDRFPEAEAVFRDAATRSPTDPMVRRNLGNALSQQGKDAEAVAAYREALQLRPEYLEVLYSLGKALMRLGKRPEAEAAFREARRLRPDDFDTVLSLGVAIFEQRRYDEAEAAFRDAIRLRAKSPTAHFNRGNSLYQLDRYAEAEAAFREAVRLRPQDAQSHVNLGHALVAQKQWPAAEKAFREAIRLAPRNAEAHRALAETLTELRRPDDAIEEFRIAIRLIPKDRDSYFKLGAVLSAQERWSEAVELFRGLRELFPRDARAVFLHAAAYLGQEKWTEAAAALRESIRLNPRDAVSHKYLGLALEQLSDAAGAEAALRDAIRLQPENADYLYALGTFLLRRENAKEAEELLRESLRLQPDSAEAQCNLGHALRRQGRYVDAVPFFRRGHELGSGRKGWRYPSAVWIEETERLAVLSDQAPAFLRGDKRPTSVELADLVEIYKTRKRYVTATRFAASLLASDATEELKTPIRYNAACYAALAAAGRDVHVSPLSLDEWAYLTDLAHRWLRVELAEWTGRSDDPKSWPNVKRHFGHWKRDPDLTAVRDAAWLAAMPADDRVRWEKLWAEVDALLGKADAAPAGAKK